MDVCCSIIPPHMLEAIAVRGDGEQREAAQAALAQSELVRSRRVDAVRAEGVAVAPRLSGLAAPNNRVHDAKSGGDLPGELVWESAKDAPESDDPAVVEAWTFAHATAQFYAEVLERNSLDGAGMDLVSTVHYLRNHNNAYWNGAQMLYGDGDGVLFSRLTGSLSVVGHELTHGVIQHSGGLVYRDQPGALNESIADVFGTLVEQHKQGVEAHEASWLVGAEVFTPEVQGDALRSLAAPGLAYDDPVLGRDPQPYHMDDFVVTTADNGGVHINSGIPNHAFYLLAQYLGGRAWERAGQIWYDALQGLDPHATFSTFAEATVVAAWGRYGGGSREAAFTKRAWHLVGVPV
ncbi:MAG TPA: M4 family metallopeptidase [Acidimicrobiales bacterium]